MSKRQVTRVRARARNATRASLTLLLIASTVWIGAYFWTHTTFGQRTLIASLLQRYDHGLVAISGVGWGPSPLSWWATGVVIGESVADPALSAEVTRIIIDPASAWSEDLLLKDARASRFGVHLQWGRDGRSNLSRLQPPRDLDAPLPKPRDWKIEAVSLTGGHVSLRWPTWGLSFEEVDCHGAIGRSRAEGLGLRADLHGDEARFDLPMGSQRFDRHHIRGFVWRRGGFEVASLGLALGEATTIAAQGRMGFRSGVSAELEGAATLAGHVPQALWSRWLPEGASFGGLRLTRTSTAPWRLGLHAFQASTLALPPWEAQGVEGSYQLDWRGRGDLPDVTLRSDGLRATSLTRGSSLHAHGLALEALELKVGLASEGRVRGLKADKIAYRQHEVHDLSVDAAAVANLAGGSLEGTLQSDSGSLHLSGPVETSLLKRRVAARLTGRLDDVRAGLAAWFRSWMPAEDRARAPERLDGEAHASLRLSASGGVAWSWQGFDWGGRSP